MQQDLNTVQADVRHIGAELEKTHRTDSKYIDLVKKEHEILLIEKEMSSKIKAFDKAERDFFASLSAAVRESHEKERARAEKTKYWSIIGSVIGAIIGIVGSTVNNHRRITQLREIVTESGETTAEYKAMTEKFLQAISNHQNLDSLKTPETLLNVVSAVDVNSSLKCLEKNNVQIIDSISKNTDEILSQIRKIHGLVVSTEGIQGESDHVYIGPDISIMLLETENKLKDEIKKNNVLITGALGGIVSLGVLVCYLIKGSS